MIYVILSKANSTSTLQKKIIEFIKQNIKNNNFEYKLIFSDKKHIIESELEEVNPSKDIVFWEPIIAYDNLELVKNFSISIVILEKPTLYTQKISEFNPINENLAINNGFYIIYIQDSLDITNEDWKLVISEDSYLMKIDKLILLISSDESNIKKEKILVEDIFSNITDTIKNQINFS